MNTFLKNLASRGYDVEERYYGPMVAEFRLTKSGKKWGLGFDQCTGEPTLLTPDDEVIKGWSEIDEALK